MFLSNSNFEILLGKPNANSSSHQLFYNNYEFKVFIKKNNSEFIEIIIGPYSQKIKLTNTQDFMWKYLRLIVFFLAIIFTSCNQVKKKQQKSPVLLADREAPLGWVYLKLYDDQSFDLIYSGLRDKTFYAGTYRIGQDTLHFNYTDSIPKAGKTALINKFSVSYIDGDYSESVVIKMNKLSNYK